MPTVLDADGSALAPDAEAAQPLYSRYWLHNRGPAPKNATPREYVMETGLFADLALVKAAKADELAVKVTDLTNAKHEASLVDALRAKLPGADPLAIRGVLGELHKAGKANRFAEDTAAELARVLPVINAEAPSLTRPPTTGGGSPGARPTPAPQRVSLIRPG